MSAIDLRLPWQPPGSTFDLDGVKYFVQEGEEGCLGCAFYLQSCTDLTRPYCATHNGSVVFITVVDAVTKKLTGG